MNFYHYLFAILVSFTQIFVESQEYNSSSSSLFDVKHNFIRNKLFSSTSFAHCVDQCKYDVCETIYKNINESQNCVYNQCENDVCENVDKIICYQAMNRQRNWSDITAEQCASLCGCHIKNDNIRDKRHINVRDDDDDDDDNDGHNKTQTKSEVKTLTVIVDKSRYSWCSDKKMDFDECQHDCVHDCEGPTKNGRFGRCYERCRHQRICNELGEACVAKCKEACKAKSILKKCKSGRIKMSASECLGRSIQMKFLYADWDYTRQDEVLVKRFCTPLCVK